MGSNNNSDSFFEAKDKAEEIKKNMGLKVAESVTTYYLPKLDCETESTYDGKKARKKLTIGMIEGFAGAYKNGFRRNVFR